MVFPGEKIITLVSVHLITVSLYHTHHLPELSGELAVFNNEGKSAPVSN